MSDGVINSLEKERENDVEERWRGYRDRFNLGMWSELGLLDLISKGTGSLGKFEF